MLPTTRGMYQLHLPTLLTPSTTPSSSPNPQPKSVSIPPLPSVFSRPSRPLTHRNRLTQTKKDTDSHPNTLSPEILSSSPLSHRASTSSSTNLVDDDDDDDEPFDAGGHSSIRSRKTKTRPTSTSTSTSTLRVRGFPRSLSGGVDFDSVFGLGLKGLRKTSSYASVVSMGGGRGVGGVGGRSSISSIVSSDGLGHLSDSEEEEEDVGESDDDVNCTIVPVRYGSSTSSSDSSGGDDDLFEESDDYLEKSDLRQRQHQSQSQRQRQRQPIEEDEDDEEEDFESDDDDEFLIDSDDDEASKSLQMMSLSGDPQQIIASTKALVDAMLAHDLTERFSLSAFQRKNLRSGNGLRDLKLRFSQPERIAGTGTQSVGLGISGEEDDARLYLENFRHEWDRLRTSLYCEKSRIRGGVVSSSKGSGSVPSVGAVSFVRVGETEMRKKVWLRADELVRESVGKVLDLIVGEGGADAIRDQKKKNEERQSENRSPKPIPRRSGEKERGVDEVRLLEQLDEELERCYEDERAHYDDDDTSLASPRLDDKDIQVLSDLESDYQHLDAKSLLNVSEFALILGSRKKEILSEYRQELREAFLKFNRDYIVLRRYDTAGSRRRADRELFSKAFRNMEHDLAAERAARQTLDRLMHREIADSHRMDFRIFFLEERLRSRKKAIDKIKKRCYEELLKMKEHFSRLMPPSVDQFSRVPARFCLFAWGDSVQLEMSKFLMKEQDHFELFQHHLSRSTERERMRLIEEYLTTLDRFSAFVTPEIRRKSSPPLKGARRPRSTDGHKTRALAERVIRQSRQILDLRHACRSLARERNTLREDVFVRIKERLRGQMEALRVEREHTFLTSQLSRKRSQVRKLCERLADFGFISRENSEELLESFDPQLESLAEGSEFQQMRVREDLRQQLRVDSFLQDSGIETRASRIESFREDCEKLETLLQHVRRIKRNEMRSLATKDWSYRRPNLELWETVRRKLYSLLTEEDSFLASGGSSSNIARSGESAE